MNANIITTDPQEELLTQVDENNNLLGSIPRGVAHEKQGIYYRTIYVLIKNADGEVLIQKRSKTKDLYPDCWDISVGGHVNYSDSYEETAVREIGEELGIEVSKEELTLKGDVLVKLPNSGEYFRIFEYILKPEDKITVSENEIGEIKWMKMEYIKKSMKDKTLKWYTRPEQVIAALY